MLAKTLALLGPKSSGRYAVAAMRAALTALTATRKAPWEDALELQAAPEQPPTGPSQLKLRVLAAGLAFPDVLSIEGSHGDCWPIAHRQEGGRRRRCLGRRCRGRRRRRRCCCCCCCNCRRPLHAVLRKCHQQPLPRTSVHGPSVLRVAARVVLQWASASTRTSQAMRSAER
jgi:hypothetical protein